MAARKQKAETHKFVVLGVKDGCGFGYLKNNLLRIVTVFENKVLSSQYVYATSAPTFNCNFTWHVENSLLKRLQTSRAKIKIELKIAEDGLIERSVGFATVGVQQAEFIAGYDSPRYRSLELRGVKLPFGVRNPQIFVSLSLQSITRLKANEECYSATLEDSQANISECSGKICDFATNQQDCNYRGQISIKKVVNKIVQNRPTVLKKNKPFEPVGTDTEKNTHTAASYHGTSEKLRTPEMHKESVLETVYYSNKSTQTEAENPSKLRTVCYSSKPYKKSVINNNGQAQKIQVQVPYNTSLPLQASQVPVVDNLLSQNYIDEKTSIITSSSLDEHVNTKSEACHLYELGLHIEKSVWYKALKNTKVLIRFFNPWNNSIATVENRRDYYIPSLMMSDITCCMYYVCVSEKLLDTVMCYPPQILIYEANNDKLVAKGTLRIDNLEEQLQSECFQTCIPLIENNSEVVGEIHVLINYQNLGIISKNTEGDSLKCVIKFHKTRKNILVEDVLSDLQQLSKIHEKLQDTYNKIKVCFQKIIEIHAVDHISKNKKYSHHKQVEENQEKGTSVSTDDRNVDGTFKKQMLQNKKTNIVFATEDHKIGQAEAQQQLNKKQHIKGIESFISRKLSGIDGPEAISNFETKSKTKDDVFEELTENKLPQKEEVLWCDFCRQFHLVRKTHDFITAIESADLKEAKSKEGVNKQVSFSKNVETENKNKLHKKDTVYRESHNKDKLVDAKLKGILKESYIKPPQMQHETNSKWKIRGSGESFQNIAVQTVKRPIKSKPREMAYLPKPAITVVKRPCQGCEQYLEVGYGQHVWQDEDITFWCKDCNIKRLQSELKDTIYSCTAEISALKNHVNNLEDEYRKHAANSVSKENYDRLRAAQHNLTMLVIHAENQNEYLHMQCSKMSEKLEELKKIVPQEIPIYKLTQNENRYYKDKEKMKEIYARVRELKQEIGSYRDKDDTTKQADQDVKENVTAVQKTIRKSEQGSVTSRKDRCEACRILQSRTKTATTTKNETNQLTVSQASKSVNKETLHKKCREKTPDLSRILCEHEIREKIANIHAKLQHYLEERDELVRVNHYTCDNIVVSYMTKTIDKLLMEWNHLKAELEKLDN